MKKIRLVSNIIINENNEILCIYKNTSKHYYPISGKIEVNENHKDASIREIFEETTLEALDVKYVTKSNQIFLNDKEIETYWYVCFDFKGTIVKDYREGLIQWIKLSEINKYDFLQGDLKIINDFKEDQIKEDYNFVYNEKRELI